MVQIISIQFSLQEQKRAEYSECVCVCEWVRHESIYTSCFSYKIVNESGKFLFVCSNSSSSSTLRWHCWMCSPFQFSFVWMYVYYIFCCCCWDLMCSSLFYNLFYLMFCCQLLLLESYCLGRMDGFVVVLLLFLARQFSIWQLQLEWYAIAMHCWSKLIWHMLCEWMKE